AQLLIDQQQKFSIEFNKTDIVNSMKISGSKDNELLYKNLQFEAGMNKRLEAVQQQLNQAEKGSDTYKRLEKEQEKLVAERKAHIQWFTDNEPNSFFTKFKIMGQNPDLKKFYKPDGSLDDQLQVYHYRKEFWEGYDFSDVRLLRTPVYFNKLKRYI